MAIVYPGGNAWVTPRADGVRITDQNCVIEPTQKIEKIDKIFVHINSDIEVFVKRNVRNGFIINRLTPNWRVFFNLSPIVSVNVLKFVFCH